MVTMDSEFENFVRDRAALIELGAAYKHTVQRWNLRKQKASHEKLT